MSLYRGTGRNEIKQRNFESDSVKIYRSGYLVDQIEILTKGDQVQSDQYYHQYTLDERGNWIRQYQLAGPRPSTVPIIVKQPNSGARLIAERLFDYY